MFLKLSTTFYLFFLVGCGIKQPTPLENLQQIDRLTHMLIGLNELSVDKNEAKDFASNSILYAQKLATEYQLISPPFFQNTLVNLGIKERGLCYEWADDLLLFLTHKNYKTLFLHRVGANIGKLNEHNALSVSSSKDGIEESILLDAWRNSGKLYFIDIEDDESYRWSERFY